MQALGGKAISLAAVRILENGPAAVSFAATFATANGRACSLTYRLTAGQPVVELRPGESVDRVLVDGEARYLVVPDFFGDDMVFRPGSGSRQALRLPAENFFLNLVDQGNALVMCVWQSAQQGAVGLRSGQGTAISGCAIDAARDKSIWIACLEGAQLWHEQVFADKDATREMTLAWKPPFSAKWRGDLLGDDTAARCWYFHSREESDEFPAGAKQPDFPCCLETGRAVVRWPQAAAAARTILVYAMDRNRETPLTAFCPIDVLRNTLGVGPCQYILQTEGLASEANPTPDNVMTWVEQQFRRKKQQKAAEEIRDLLGQMVEHVGHVQTRIEQYDRFGSELGELCQAAAAKQPPVPGATVLGATAARLEQTAVPAAAEPPGRAYSAACCEGN